jgi:hypothetical protein
MALPLGSTTYINDPNLISYWPLNGNSTDAGTGGNNGVDVNVTYVAGQTNFGSSASLPGANNSAINVGTKANLNITSSVSYNIWAKRSGAGTEGEVLMAKGTSVEVAIGYQTQLILLTSGKVAFQVSNGTTEVAGTTSGSVTDGNYYMITGVYNSPGSQVIIYRNGTAEGTTTVTYASLLSTNGTLSLGAAPNAARLRDFTGTIDDVAVFNKALTSTDASNLFAGIPVLTGVSGYKSLLGVGQA